MRSIAVNFRMCCVWWRTNSTNISGTYALSACGAESSERPRPFEAGPDTLFVAYSAWAEMTCFKVLGWKFPTHIFDQHTAYLAASNILLLRKKPRKRLSVPRTRRDEPTPVIVTHRFFGCSPHARG